jgi:hypothetical protein
VMNAFRVNTWADIPRAITAADAAGAIGLSELLRALRDGESAVLPIAPDMSCSMFKTFCRTTSGRPAIVLVGDDDGMDRGAAGWPLALRVLRWASRIMLHAAGAERRHYRAAVTAAALYHRIAIIECSATTVDSWVAALHTLRVPPPPLVIWPRDGMHPIPLDRGMMQ